MKFYEIRDPIFGFITINEWERDIINHRIFQRLRRIKQLAWTDMVYPGATHTRFEHSLGVMKIATDMFNCIANKGKSYLQNELKFTEEGIRRDLILVRLASLLHDVGHPPFSHAGEGLMSINPESGKSYKHEDYTEAIIRYKMKDVIDDHPLNENYRITADEVADFLAGKSGVRRSILWRGLVTGQMDADRADYLLRDSHHIGVQYGRYDLKRLLVTLTVTSDENEGPVLAIEEGGWHAAEGLILARYMMFTQVYFQHTRRAYDHHVAAVMKQLLEEFQTCEHKGKFPPPTSAENIDNYLEWDDWRVLGLIRAGYGGEDGRILRERKHHRFVYQTSEVPDVNELNQLERVCEKLGTLVSFIDSAEKSWYKFDKEDVYIYLDDHEKRKKPKTVLLSSLSSVVRGLNAVKQQRVYVPWERKKEAEEILEGER
ncbi:HD superfamily phosphohydrolases [Moorella thermoacetica Y72]|uniref:HD superfamily phosphohydrolases n=1 Tax=Moorella thermoacetica Y72 TaxID=1325331 RepID=A0A0S6UDR5_NEOTH|nr:HD domain-containing protein [Moorella thermoacetica]GAF26388.1 HD superfamily phosphohydrolases [Moorella thermoacetica Y72]